MYNLIKIDESFLDEQWQELFEVRHSQQPVITFNLKSWQSLKEAILGCYKNEEKYICYTILNSKGKCIGNFSCYEDENETENIGRVLRPKVNLLPEWQTDEVIGLFLGKLVETYDNSLKIRFIDYNGLNDKWLVKWSGIFKIHIENYNISRYDLKLDEIEGIAKSGILRNHDLTLCHCMLNELNDEELSIYVDLWNLGCDWSLQPEVVEKYNFKHQLSVNDVKQGFTDKKELTQLVILYDKDRSVVGFSEIYVSLSDGHEGVVKPKSSMYKAMTYVKPEYRGKGLAKWMNAELYIKILDNYDFDVINSQMSPRNEFMIRINREFGYKKLENSYEKEYVFELSEIQKLLQH